MKALIVSGTIFFAIVTARAETVIGRYDWQELQRSGALLGGVPEMVDGKSVLVIRNTNASPLQVQLFKIKQPAITNTLYAVLGEVKYDNVQGDGFLEMWNFYPPIQAGAPEGQYFSRTLAFSGELGKLSGTSGWRRFTLPFDRTGASGPPTRLEINVYLPGSGTVYLSPVRLVEYPAGVTLASAMTPAGAWWSEPKAGLIFGLSGAFVGTLCSLLAWLASKGRARVFVTVTMIGLTVIGAVFGVVGMLALLMKQPFFVWFPSVLFSVLLLGILPYRLWHFHKHYQNMELRKIVSADTMAFQ